MREAFSHVTRVAILSNPLHPGEQRELKELEQAPNGLISGLLFKCGRPPNEPAFERIQSWVPKQ